VAAATGERGQSLYRYQLDSVAVRAGNNFLLCLRAGHLMVEQSEPAAGPLMGRRVGEPADPLLSGKEQCGAALRGHACDDISRIRSAYRRSIRNS